MGKRVELNWPQWEWGAGFWRASVSGEQKKQRNTDEAPAAAVRPASEWPDWPWQQSALAGRVIWVASEIFAPSLVCI
jgi:hypothetical protein